MHRWNRNINNWCIPNLIRGAIGLVCGSPIIGCVLAECKVHHIGKWEQQQHRTSLDHLRVQHKCTVMGEINGNILKLPVSTLQGRFGEWHKYPMCIFSHTCNTNLNQKTSWEVPCSKQFGYSCSNCANYRKSRDEVKEQNNCKNADRADNLSLPQKGWREKGTGQASSHGLKEDLRSRPGARTGSRRRQSMLPPPDFLFLPFLLWPFRLAEHLTRER